VFQNRATPSKTLSSSLGKTESSLIEDDGRRPMPGFFFPLVLYRSQVSLQERAVLKALSSQIGASCISAANSPASYSLLSFIKRVIPEMPRRSIDLFQIRPESITCRLSTLWSAKFCHACLCCGGSAGLPEQYFLSPVPNTHNRRCDIPSFLLVGCAGRFQFFQ